MERRSKSSAIAKTLSDILDDSTYLHHPSVKNLRQIGFLALKITNHMGLFGLILCNIECVMTNLRLRTKANITSQASGRQEACFTWIVSECKLRSKQMLSSVFSLHHLLHAKF